MRGILGEEDFEQIPQMTSSGPIDVNKKFDIVPDGVATGERRAVMIGINYEGYESKLDG